jgi:hypothetical protein
MENLWTVTQVAEKLNVNRMRVHRWLKAGEFPHAKRVSDLRTSPWLIPGMDVEVFRLRWEAQLRMEAAISTILGESS